MPKPPLKITRKYWDHLRDKIILGPLAYLKFPPFDGLVKLPRVGTQPEKPVFCSQSDFDVCLIS
jgi:hypothetical protein